MSPTWARMPHRSALGLFLHRLHEIVERLEFADELHGRHPNTPGRQVPEPPIDPDHLVPDSAPFRGDGFVAVDRLLCDVMAECRKTGRAGAMIVRQAEGIWGRLKACGKAHNEGDLEPWRSARADVAEALKAFEQRVERRPAPQAAPPIVPPGTAKMAAVRLHGDELIAPAGGKVERVEKVPNAGGRKAKKPGERRQDEAAWWRDRADAIPGIGDVEVDDHLRLYDLLTEYGEVTLRELGQEPVPAWWPRDPHGQHKSGVRFVERFHGVAPKNFKKYLQRYDNEQARPIDHRHRRENVEPASKPTTRVRRRDDGSAAIEAIELAMEQVAELSIDPRRHGQIIALIRTALSAGGNWTERDVDHLCGLSPEEMIGTLQLRKRRIEKAMRDLAGRTKSRS